MTAMLLAPLPVASVLLLVLFAVLPWGGPDWLEMALALVPISAIYFWSLHRPRLMPAAAIFVLGLVIDVMTQGALGIWASAALAAGLAGRLARRSRMHLGWARRAVFASAALAIAASLVAGATSIYGWQIVPARPVLEAFVVACLIYPALAAVLSAADRCWPGTDGRSLFMRGD